MAPFDDAVDPVAQAKAIVGELKKYDAALYDKPRWLVLNKLDMVPADERAARVKDFVKRLRVQGAGVRDLGADARGLRAAGARRSTSTSRRSRWPSSRRPRSIRASPTDACCRLLTASRNPMGRAAQMTINATTCCAMRAASWSRSAPAWSPTKAAASTKRAIGEWCRQLAALVQRRARGGHGVQRRDRRGHEAPGLDARARTRCTSCRRPPPSARWAWRRCTRPSCARTALGSAQVLLTHADLADRERYLNARSTLLTLLRCGVVPVINENDTVVNDEIKFGDNDTLGALVANLVEADALVILTDQKGLYTADPRKDPDAQLRARGRGRRSGAGSDGRRRRLQHRPRRHDHQDPGGQARGRLRRVDRDRLGPRARRAAAPGARRGDRHAAGGADRRSTRRASAGWPTTCSCAAR